MKWLRALALACLALLLGHLADATESAADGDWRFEARLDGKPIGEHRFSVWTQGGERHVESRAAFDVKLLGFSVYRYRHQASETWRGGCLVALSATTEDDGKTSRVSAETKGDRLVVVSPTGRQDLSGCVMSFAYWNPALAKQSHLLNPQTGRYEAVEIGSLGNAALDEQGKTTPAKAWRIAGASEPIEVWYSMQGDWLGLDATVAGGRKLTYRLK